MNYMYTATFIPNEDETKYYCKVPDLPGCITTGNSLNDAIEMITDAASGWLVIAEDEVNEIPAATPQHKLDIPENAVCSSYTVQQPIQDLFVKMFLFLHGWLHWRKNGA